jgi:hypothetical protein
MQAELDEAAEMKATVQQLVAELTDAQQAVASLESDVLRHRARAEVAHLQNKARCCLYIVGLQCYRIGARHCATPPRASRRQPAV